MPTWTCRRSRARSRPAREHVDWSDRVAALAGDLVHCVRVAISAGVHGDLCGTAARIGSLGKRAVEHRTGIDCQSCKAKLGTPQGEGTDCVAAQCDAFGGPFAGQ